MNLISLQFGAFFLGLLVVYYLVPIKLRWWVLLAGSAAFYLLSATPYTSLYLVFSISSVYFAAKYISNENKSHKKVVYILTLLVNVGLLAFLKYLNGFWAMGSRVFLLAGIKLPILDLGWIAPLGISFYTLQLIGYLTDIYWGINPAQKNPAKIALFASYFPVISSGPILRYNQIENELFEGHKANYKNITFGLQRMLWGLFKKLVIAERTAAIAKPIFDDFYIYNGIWIWIGLLAAVIQIYADFSGNMDFILGISECFGIKLPENFRQPFFSLTIQEFWQRWHISLGNWLKDYVMYPLLRSKSWVKLGKFVKKRFGKKAAKLFPAILAMFILWLANGIWHAGYPKYMATVIWFWFAVTMGQILEPVGDKIVKLLKINANCFSWRLFQRLRTIFVYSVGALFFCSSGVGAAFKMIEQAFFGIRQTPLLNDPILHNETLFSKTLMEFFGGRIGMNVILISLIMLIGVEIYQNRGGDIRKWLAKQNLVFRWGILLAFMFSILLFGVYGPDYDAAEFIYAGF